jgi:hypothetical protein
MRAAACSRARELGRIAVIAATMMAGCNERTPILDADVVTTAPSPVVPAAPLPPDNISRIAFAPPGNRGGTTGRGTVYLEVPARDGGRVVSLRSADAPILSLSPSTIVVPEGATSADFSFTTRAVQRDVNVTITASSGERTISDYVSVWTATTSFMAYTADPGMVNTALAYRVSSDAGGRVTGGCDSGGAGLFGNVSIPNMPGVTVVFAAPRGQPMLPGIYDNATNTGGTPGNYLNVSSAPSCQGIGRVELHEVSLLANGIATSLWFTFEQRCLNQPGVIRGTYRVIVPGAAATGRQCVR